MITRSITLSFLQTKVTPTGKEAKEEITAGVTSTLEAQLPEAAGSLQKSIGGMVTSEDKDGLGQSGDQLSNSSHSSSSSVTVTSSSSSSEAKSDSGAQPAETEVRGSSTTTAPELEPQAREQDRSTGASEAEGRLVQAEVHASLENGEEEPPSSSPSSDEKGADSECREEEDNDEDGSRREDYSEGDLVDISAYSGLGEDDSGGSQLDDDDEDEEYEEAYQLESSCSEIPGLPEEEEPAPPSRKICFSTEPIRVRNISFVYSCPASIFLSVSIDFFKSKFYIILLMFASVLAMQRYSGSIASCDRS